jgi:hypothetical protein
LLLMRMTSTPSGSAAGAPAPPARPPPRPPPRPALTSLAATGLTGGTTGLHRHQFFVSARGDHFSDGHLVSSRANKAQKVTS